jgi:magnesium transporter
VPRAATLSSVAELRAALAGGTFDCVTEVAVCEGDRLLGLVSIERAFAAEPDARVGDLLDEAPLVVHADADLEQVALRAAQEGHRSAAVTDTDGRLLGIVPANALLGVLLVEHEEDVARLTGLRSSTSLARAASEEAVTRRLWHRFPWLLIGLLGAMLSAGIVAAFEEQIRDEVLLALFVPAVVYMADAVGTQTEAVVIRGMAVGVPISRVFGRELAAGTIIGVLIGVCFFLFAFAVWGNTRVAATVGIALFVSSSLATLIAMVLPYVLARFGRDPAFGSGPLATVIQDLLSILVYFTVGLVLVD